MPDRHYFVLFMYYIKYLMLNHDGKTGFFYLFFLEKYQIFINCLVLLSASLEGNLWSVEPSRKAPSPPDGCDIWENLGGLKAL